MRAVYFGSGEFGLPTLRWLAGRHQVVAVVTQPSRPAGRRRQPKPTPIAAWAGQAGLEVIESADVNSDAFVERVGAVAPDVGVVIAFGQKLGPGLVDVLGALSFNLHASLLPRHRGATPINRAILSGDAETGLSVISLAQRMDAGLIYAQASTAIDPAETAGELHDRLAEMGPGLVGDVIDRHAAGLLEGAAQDESLATPAPRLTKADGYVDFAQPAVQVRRRVHGLTPWPGVSVELRHADQRPGGVLILKRVAEEAGDAGGLAAGTMIDGTRVAAGDGVVRLIQVQPAGGRVMTIEEYARGHSLERGDVLVPVRPG